MEKKLYTLTVDPELHDLIPPLTDEEYRMLEDSIVRDGCDTAITVWNNTIVDGHNRYEICTKHGVPFAIEKKEFPDKDAVIFWMLEHQLARRNLNSYQRGQLALRYEPLEQKRARANQKSGQDLGLKSGQGGRVAGKLATLAGVSRDTINKVKKINAAADEETKRQLRTGMLSINKAYSDIKAQEHADETRVCPRCGLEKPYAEFRLPSNRSTPRSICMQCEEDIQRAKIAAEQTVPPSASESASITPGAHSDTPATTATTRDLPPSGIIGVAMVNGKLGHVSTGIPDQPDMFPQVMSIIESATRAYITTFEAAIKQYHNSMINDENTHTIRGMMQYAAETITQMLNDHIKEEQ